METQTDLWGEPAPPPPRPRPRPPGPTLKPATVAQRRLPCDPCLIDQHNRARRGEPWGWRGRVEVAWTDTDGTVTLLCGRHATAHTADKLPTRRSR